MQIDAFSRLGTVKLREVWFTALTAAVWCNTWTSHPRDEGWTTLFRGGQSTLLSVAVSNFLYFYSFHGLKTLTGAKNQKAVKDLLFACVAGEAVTSDVIKYKASLATSCSGCINVLLTNPLWVVNSRLKMAGIKNEVQKYKGTLDGLIKIAMEVNTLYITIVTML